MGTAAPAGEEVQQGKHLLHRYLAAHLREIDGAHGRAPSAAEAGNVLGTDQQRRGSGNQRADLRCGFDAEFSGGLGVWGCLAPWAR